MKRWRVPILISYAYWDKKTADSLLRWGADKFRLYLDSGAFTAHKQGKEIDFDEYCAFVKDPPVPIERYFMLDVIGDPDATKRNLDRMLKKRLNPVPVFTRGEEVKTLDDFYSVSDLVALGGVAGTPGAESYVKWFEEEVRDGRPVHWLGFAQRDFVLHFKPTSFDSTTWIAGCRYGFIQLFHDGWRRVERKDILAGKFRRQITELGFEYGELKKEESWHRVARESYIGQVTAVSWLRWARRLEERGSEAVAVIHPGLDIPNMTRAFAVVISGGSSTPNSPESTFRAYNMARERGIV